MKKFFLAATILLCLRGGKGIGIAELGAADVVRHEVVSRIVEAYDNFDARRFAR